MNINCQFFNEVTSDIRYIREVVFIEEQGFKEEFDDIDKRAIHALIYFESKPIATGRIFKKEKSNDIYIIGRVAVLKEYRKLNVGIRLINELEGMARTIGAIKIQLSSQYHAKAFYLKNNYITVGNVYMDEDCQHILMEKTL
ncbi:MAG: GNAT family N-acetyltransferase [Firmicutes bacterium]|nr:GNAT family N-acetyltransferase [Bacillota bacterium]